MQISHLVRYVFTAALCLTALAVGAKEVTQTYKGLTLNANLELAAGKTLADGVILITHGSLAHRDMEIIRYLRKLFRERGDNTLAINLSLGFDNRHGMYDCQTPHRHRNDDAAEEIAAWVDWLKGQGAQRVAVLGHSRGGAQTALYAAEHDDAVVKAVVLMAPATAANTDAAGYARRFNKPLAPLLARAQRLVAAGKGDTLLEHSDFLFCADTSVTAAAFVSYYGAGERVDSPALIARIGKPTLVVVAGSDEVVMGLDTLVAPLADGKRVRMKVIDGAGHFFRDLYADDAVDAIDRFLQGAGD